LLAAAVVFVFFWLAWVFFWLFGLLVAFFSSFVVFFWWNYCLIWRLFYMNEFET